MELKVAQTSLFPRKISNIKQRQKLGMEEGRFFFLKNGIQRDFPYTTRWILLNRLYRSKWSNPEIPREWVSAEIFQTHFHCLPLYSSPELATPELLLISTTLKRSSSLRQALAALPDRKFTKDKSKQMRGWGEVAEWRLEKRNRAGQDAGRPTVFPLHLCWDANCPLGAGFSESNYETVPGSLRDTESGADTEILKGHGHTSESSQDSSRTWLELAVMICFKQNKTRQRGKKDSPLLNVSLTLFYPRAQRSI